MIDISKMTFPTTTKYYEKSSADGYAFLGIARHSSGLNVDACEKAIDERAPKLNEPWKNISLSKNASFVYTMWPCHYFYGLINRKDKRDRLIDILTNKIGFYPNGAIRYSDEEVHFCVPNVTPIAALLFARSGDIERAKNLIQVLEKWQLPNGNWPYKAIDDTPRKKPLALGEDSPHLAMMIICLDNLMKEYGIDTSSMIKKAFNVMIDPKTPGSMFFDPFRFVAFNQIGDRSPLWKSAYDISRTLLKAPNFRTRAIAAWALTGGKI
jgi:hypothetical protein